MSLDFWPLSSSSSSFNTVHTVCLAHTSSVLDAEYRLLRGARQGEPGEGMKRVRRGRTQCSRTSMPTRLHAKLHGTGDNGRDDLVRTWGAGQSSCNGRA